jgi:hypothetical protein
MWIRELFQKNESRVINAKLCQNPWTCNFCAKRKSLRLYRHNYPLLRAVIDNDPQLRVSHLVKTVKSGPCVATQRQKLMDARKRLRNGIRHGGVNGRPELIHGRILGAFESFESHWGLTPGHHHFHSHSLVLHKENLPCFSKAELHERGWLHSPELIPPGNLNHEWMIATGDSFMVHCEEVDRSDPDQFAQACCEVFKYQIKAFHEETQHQKGKPYSPADCVDVWLALRGARMHFRTGLLYSLKLDAGELDDPDPGDEVFQDILYRWKQGKDFRSSGYDMEEIKDMDGNVTWSKKLNNH